MPATLCVDSCAETQRIKKSTCAKIAELDQHLVGKLRKGTKRLLDARVTAQTQRSPVLSVGTFVILDGSQSGEIAVANDDGSWDLILDDGSEVDGVAAARIQPSASQERERPADPSTPEEREAAAAALRLKLTGSSGAAAE
eukprot:4656113-Prymnesium_polylepis.1